MRSIQRSLSTMGRTPKPASSSSAQDPLYNLHGCGALKNNGWRVCSRQAEMVSSWQDLTVDVR